MKIELLDLKFTNEYFYIQKKSIVEKITFNNRTFYSKFERTNTALNSVLLEQHYKNDITLAMPLIEHDRVNYLVIEYHQNDWNSFYSLAKHLLKSLEIQKFQAYRNEQRELFQIFIPRENLELEEAYIEVDNIKHLLQLKSKQSYKIYPNKLLPKNLNIITLPIQKV